MSEGLGDRLVRWAPYALVGGAVALVVRRAAVPLSDPDAWWHLRLGNDLIDQHSLSAPSHWSTFATVPWVPTEPLPEIVAAQFDRWFGLPGVAWLVGLALVLVVASLYLTNRLRADPAPAAVVTIVALTGASLSLVQRPQLVSFALLPVVLAAWFASERDGRPRWWLVPLTWLWSMLHGFWIFGLAVGVAMLAGMVLDRRVSGRALTRLATVAVASAAVVLLNPAGPGIFGAPFRVRDTSRYIQEWQRTDLSGHAPITVAVMVAVCVVIWIRLRFRPPTSRLLLIATALVCAWYAERLVAIGSVLVAPVMAESLQMLIPQAETTQGFPRHPHRTEVMGVMGWAGVCLALLAFAVPHTSARPGGIPVALDGPLARLPAHSTVLNDYVLGGWLVWRHPDLNQVIDGLATPYPGPFLRRYADALDGRPGWRGFVADVRPRAALLERGTPLIARLRASGWSEVATSQGYVLLEPGNS